MLGEQQAELESREEYLAAAACEWEPWLARGQVLRQRIVALGLMISELQADKSSRASE